MEAVGFEQQVDIDPCLFISPKVICLVYVDDTLLYARRQEDIDEVLHKLEHERKMSLEAEDEVAGFLGVHIKRDSATGQVVLTQEGLTNRIIAALGCENLPGVDTPADCVLGKDEDGEPLVEKILDTAGQKGTGKWTGVIALDLGVPALQPPRQPRSAQI